MPSPDQDGFLSVQVLLVSLVSPLPSALIEKISVVNPTNFAKAIIVPSGDHVGVSYDAAQGVIVTSPVPSALITWIDHPAADLLTKAILFPSGDHAGDLSNSP